MFTISPQINQGQGPGQLIQPEEEAENTERVAFITVNILYFVKYLTHFMCALNFDEGIYKPSVSI